ncbi:MAG TPA: TlpA disulfide reductase family protein [Bacteroidota bacterium]|nr:TlpA disulfide reductase family protein [Bacteroidota bacterium]
MNKICLALFVFAFFFLLNTTIHAQSVENILRKTEERINALNCISYKSIHSSSVAGDTTLFYRYTAYFDVTSNPEDAVFGSSFKGSFKDSTKIDLDYHDNLEIRYNWDKKTLSIDTINAKIQYVGLNAPVPFKMKSLIRYWRAHRDSVECTTQQKDNSIELNFVIRHMSALFINLKPYIVPNDSVVSCYSVRLNNEYLPIWWKARISETVQDEIAYTSINKCDSSQPKTTGVIIPEGFALYDPKGVRMAPSDLEGQMVSPWVLERVEGDSARSGDFKGKTLLIEFTGAGCGPCEQSIPFLKSIAETYREKNVVVLSVETWETHRLPLKRFKDSHALNYEYLISNEEVNKRYMVGGVPMFMIVDKNNVIRKVFQGFGKGETDQEIGKILTQLP